MNKDGHIIGKIIHNQVDHQIEYNYNNMHISFRIESMPINNLNHLPLIHKKDYNQKQHFGLDYELFTYLFL